MLGFHPGNPPSKAHPHVPNRRNPRRTGASGAAPRHRPPGAEPQPPDAPCSADGFRVSEETYWQGVFD